MRERILNENSLFFSPDSETFSEILKGRLVEIFLETV